MLTTIDLTNKRRVKEEKRKAKRKAIHVAAVKALKGRKLHNLTVARLRFIRTQPELLKQYNDYRDGVKAERARRKAEKYGTV